MAGALAASKPLHLLSQPTGSAPLHAAGQLAPGTRLYAAVRASRLGGNGLAAFMWNDAAWVQQQFEPAPEAGPMLADADGQRFFVAHHAGPSGSPAGTVETLQIDRHTGRFTRGSQQALALASRCPLALALSPDRTMLAVVAAGGVFSLLPFEPDGTLSEVSAAYKQMAVTLDPGSAVALLFQPSTVGTQPSFPQLTLTTDAQCVNFACRYDGLMLAGPSTAQPASAGTATPPLPEGVQSFLVLPPLA